MHRYAIKFTKKGDIRYISHLDLLRLFKRTFKRLNVKLLYSQGFNPHPKMGFAQPLSLGYESNGEILEIETVNKLDSEELIEMINKIMPEGLKVTACMELENVEKSLAAITETAKYTIHISQKCKNENDIEIHKFLSQEKIIVQKLNKKKELIDLDIKPMIRKISVISSNENIEISALIDAGSVSNLSPELLIKAIGSYYKLNFDRSDVKIVRENIGFTNKLQI